MREVPGSVRWFIVGIAAVGGWLLFQTVRAATWDWIRVASLALAVGLDFMRIDLRQYSHKHKVIATMDIVIIFLMMGLFGPAWAMLTVLLNGLVYSVTARLPLHKMAFNLGSLLLACWLASQALSLTAVPWLLTLPLAVCSYFLVNTGSVALIIGLLNRRSPLKVWRENSAWMAVQHMTLAMAGFVLGKVTGLVGWWVLLAALPIPMLHYTFALYARADEQRIREQEAVSAELITTLAAIVDARDAYTFGHSTYVARYSAAIAEAMGYSEEAVSRLYRSALLHDIGKVGIPEAILYKPGRLTPDEYELMKRHTTIGHQIVRQITSLADAATVALRHHEHWNGKGYPQGLAGDQVDMDSRIVGVADTLETLLSDRPYRRGRPLEEALAEIDRCAGTQFDPVVVRALHAVVARKGRDFFVNSAALVQRDAEEILRWSPAASQVWGATAHQ